MTADLLREYIDAALSKRDQWIFALWFVTPFISLVAGFLGSYLGEKGKNRATKEDVGKITEEIERSRTIYSEQMERLKAELASRSYYSKARYEREMKIYEELWPKLCALKEAVLSLRPVMEAAPEAGETKEQRDEKRRQAYLKAVRAAWESVEHNRPFYPPELWQELRKLLDLCWHEAVGWRRGDNSRFRDYWEEAIQNSKAINDQVDAISDSIRGRLTKFDHPDVPLTNKAAP